MSYSISIYQPTFLRRALEEQLGDWTSADPFPSETQDAIANWLLAHGYALEYEHPDFGRRFTHPNSAWGMQVGVYRGEITFAIPYWPDATNAIVAAKTDALKLANLAKLAVYDPQIGEIEE